MSKVGLQGRGRRQLQGGQVAFAVDVAAVHGDQANQFLNQNFRFDFGIADTEKQGLENAFDDGLNGLGGKNVHVVRSRYIVLTCLNEGLIFFFLNEPKNKR